MTYYRKLAGEKCYLSPIQPEDAIAWTAWMNDLEVTLPLGDEAYIPYSLERMHEDIMDAIQRQQHIFSIVTLADDQLIGRCLLFATDTVNRSAMLGIFIGQKEFWGQGYGQEATRLLLDYAFNLLNLHSVMLGAFNFNERAIHAYERVGFKTIGRRREARLIGGQAYDVVFMDMLESEFRERYPSVIRM